MSGSTTRTLGVDKSTIIPPLYRPASGASEVLKAPRGALISKVPLLRWDRREDICTQPESTRPIRMTPAADLARNRTLPDPKVWSRNMSRVLFDVLAGRRDAATIRRWVEPHLFRRLQTRAAANNTRVPQTIPARVLSGRICRLSDTVVESSVVIQEQGRSRAVAMRLEAFRGRWKITALEIG